MTAKARNYLLISIAVFFFAALLVVVCSRKKAERPEPEILSKTAEDGASAEFIKVKLFYYSELSNFLQPVYREIQVPEIREELYKKFIDLLLAGSSGLIIPVPDGVQLRSVYYLQKMEMLVLDFNDNLINAFPGGTAAELEFIYFIVDNICYNFKEIKKVKILSGGNENKTLAGHIDLEKPFFPDFNWIKSE
ncbi:MAG: GerMN domain-containing protein [Chrysiogenales bacterium]